MSDNIVVKDAGGVKKFLSGNYVFKIECDTKMRGMATTKEEYEKKLASHQYISILHVAPLTYKLAYLYDCLNREKGTPRGDTFIFFLRAVGTQEWTEWFSVRPYLD